MPISMTLNTADRNALVALLTETPNPADSDMRGLAQRVLLRDLDTMEAKVRKFVSDLRTSERRNADFQQRQYFQFVAPLPAGAKPTVVSENADTKVIELPQRQTFKVTVRNLTAFCRANKLKEADMIEVGMGRVKSHRGWERRGGFGPNHLCLGNEYKDVSHARPVDAPTGQRQVVKVVHQFAPSIVVWAPEQ